MIVQCPQCSSRCSVKGENIPAGGGRIRCPSCQHMYVVYPESSAVPSTSGMLEEDKTSVATNIKDLISRLNEMEDEDDGKTQVLSGKLPDFAKMGLPQDLEDGTVEMKNPFVASPPLPQPSAPSPQDAPPTVEQQAPYFPPQQQSGTPQAVQPTPTPAPPQGPDTTHSGPWKIKSSLGIPMSFTDAESLKNWLDGRDDYDACELSSDGGQSYYSVHSFPQITGVTAPQEQRVPAVVGAPSVGLGSASSAPSFGSGPSEPYISVPAPDQSQPMPQSAGVPAPAQPYEPHRRAPRPAGQPQGAKILENTYQPPSRDAKWAKVLWFIFIVLTLACIGVGLHIAKIVDFKQLAAQVTGQPLTPPAPPVQKTVVKPKVVIPPKEKEPQVPKPAKVVEPEKAPAVALSPEQQKQVETLLENAKRHIKAKKLATAEDELKLVISLDAKRLEALDMLAQVYELTGREKESRQTREKVSKLRAESNMEAMDNGEGLPSITPK